MPAFPRERRTTGAKSEGLCGRGSSGYLGKKPRSILGNIFCDEFEEMEQVLTRDSKKCREVFLDCKKKKTFVPL